MDELTIRVLGPVGVERAGLEVRLGGPQQRAVLALLARTPGSATTRDELIDGVWPDDPPTTATKVVQKHVSGLRRELGDDVIETVGGGYRLAVDPAAVDAVRFERAVDATRTIDRPGAVVERITSALTEWRGDPYSGIGDLPLVDVERARLGALRRRALADRAGALLDLGRPEDAIAELEQLTRTRPEDERFAALLMRALYLADRQVEALRTYQRVRRHLRDELGVEPSPELRELERQILDHDEMLRPATTATDAAPEPADPAAGTASAEPTPDDARSDRSEEVRHVILVVADDRSATPGGLAADDALREHERLVAVGSEVAERFGGRLDRSTGVRLAIVFGVPAHDHDARRAVAAADELAGLRPSARVAVAAGDAVVSIGTDGGLVAGSVIGRADELIERADPGTPLLDATVRRRLAPSPALPEPGMLGRDRERAAIRAAWDGVIADGSLRAVDVIGEPGIGKTRLLQAIVDDLTPSPAHVIEFDFAPTDDSGWVEAIAGMIERQVGGADGLAAWLQRFGLEAGEVDWLYRRLVPLLDDQPRDSAEGGSSWEAAVVRLWESLAEAGPLLVLVEDVHWAREDFDARAADITARLTTMPILVVTTRRPQPARRVGAGLAPQIEHLTLRLAPLAAKASHDLAGRLAAGVLPDETLNSIVRRAGGNPLFVQQYVRMLLERPDSDPGSDHPTDVSLVIAARIDLLDPEARQVLLCAAVLAERVDEAGLSALTGLPPDVVGGALGELVRAGLMRRAPSRATAAVEFHHGLVADVAYRQLTRQRRADLHERAARMLEERSSTAIDDVLATARHWQEVVDLRGDAGQEVDASLRAHARRAHLAAADRLEHVDPNHAIGAFRAALETVEAGSTERGEILLRLAEITTDAGGFERALPAYEEAAQIFTAAGRIAEAAEATARHARSTWYLGDGARTDELMERARELVADAEEGRATSHVLVLSASQHMLRGDAALALEESQRALPIVRRHGTTEDLVRLLQSHGLGRFDVDDVGGIADMREALDLSLEHGFSRLASQAYNNLAELIWAHDGPLDALELAHDGLELATARGVHGQAPWHYVQILELLYDLGRWDEMLDETLSPELAPGHPLASISIEWLLARIGFWRGGDRSLEELVTLCGRAREARDRQTVVPVFSSTIAALAADGRWSTAADLADELVEQSGDHGHNRLREAGDAVRGLVAAGRVDAAIALVPEERPQVQRRALQWDGAMAHIAEAEERWSDAVDLYTTAEAGWDRFPHVVEAGHAASGLMRCHRRTGREADARAADQRARERFAAVGASRALDWHTATVRLGPGPE